MKKVVKAIMYVYRKNNGKKEFFVLHRKIGDAVILTGHVGDNNINESTKDAAIREVVEELGVEPLMTIDLKIRAGVELLENGKKIMSEEHSFLIEILNKDVHFLEGDEEHKWHSISDLYNVLTYVNQKKPLDKIKGYLLKNK